MKEANEGGIDLPGASKILALPELVIFVIGYSGGFENVSFQALSRAFCVNHLYLFEQKTS